jgi:RNA polymerase sigma-70 factor (ECF subfamily)
LPLLALPLPAALALVLLAAQAAGSGASEDGGGTGDAGDLDDPALAARIRDGDRAAFRAFFERHYDRLFGYLRRMRVPADVADDLAQTAFVYVWTHRDGIDPAQSLRSYLFRIGHTRALNHFRDTRKHAYDAPPDDPDAPRPSPAPAPDAETEASLVQERLRAAIAELPARRRAVFELCFVEDLTYREAAETLDISVKTVENQMTAAFKHVRAALAMYR